MCFHSGLLPLFLSTSSTYCEPLWNIFFPVSPAYFDSSWRLHTIHSISLPSPVFLHIPSCPVLQVKHFSLLQCSFALLPGTLQPNSCPSDLPPLSVTAIEMLVPFNSSMQIFLKVLASKLPGVGGMMKTPSLTLVPLSSLLYHLSPFSCLLLLLSSSWKLWGRFRGLFPSETS